ncbi:MAG: hypothetical protein EBE86_005885 [Hormoscilla sp. GUM202]|nr:hypothetical protein [Hormoscilla sp. GM7CHS1pb]MBO1346944.1 hypothetical protein [Hormoscilla sp. GUM202]
MIQGEGFTIDESKFDYFFGRVTSNPHNTERSWRNYEGLRRLGIEETTGGRERLLQIFQSGLNQPIIDRKENSYGITLVRKVEIDRGSLQGSIEISYFYTDGDLESIPKISSIITKIYK